MWNLLQWRASQTPGLERTNLRLGEVAVLTTRLGTESVEIVSPDGEMSVQSVPDRTINLKAEAVGVYEIRAGTGKYAFSSNALYQAESDLTNKATGVGVIGERKHCGGGATKVLRGSFCCSPLAF